MPMPRRGVRYYQAVPPPEDEWAPDYAAMSRAGLDFAVVPVPWALSHTDAEAFDFAPLLAQLDLAREHGLQVVAAIDLGAAPLWLVRTHPEYLYEYAIGSKAMPTVERERAGWWPGICFDNDGARAHAERFLRAVAAQAKGHPALAGYQVAPDSMLEGLLRGTPLQTCLCAATLERFVAWLRARYADDLAALGAAWSQRFTQWSDVAPLCYAGQFPPNIDWRRFQMESFASHLAWCASTLREADSQAPIIGGEGLFGGQALPGAEVLTRPVHASGEPMDRLLPHESAAWAGPAREGRRVWLTNLPTRDVQEMRLTHWSALVAGADAWVYDAWRPERAASASQRGLACPDGSPSRRLAEANSFAELLGRHPELAAARPLAPEAAVCFVPEAWSYWISSFWERDDYFVALLGAYRALASGGAQVAFAEPDGLEPFPAVYLPLALTMSQATADALRRYVRAGGRLVAEACTARIGEQGLAGRASPGLGLDELFGARGIEVCDVPPDGPPPTFRGRHGSFPCSGQWEPLEATTGAVKARFADGSAAIVDNTVGKGATRLIGTFPSSGYADKAETTHARVILDSLAFAKVQPRLNITSPKVCARLLEGEDGATFLCAFNLAATAQEATVRVSRSVAEFRRAHDLVSGKRKRLRDNALRLKLGPGEGVALRLDSSPRPRWRPGRKPRAD